MVNYLSDQDPIPLRPGQKILVLDGDDDTKALLTDYLVTTNLEYNLQNLANAVIKVSKEVTFLSRTDDTFRVQLEDGTKLTVPSGKHVGYPAPSHEEED